MSNANDNDYKLYRRNDPDTSVDAAKQIASSISQIQAEVLQYAASRGDHGFTDDDLNAHFQSTSSTYRSRRAELTSEEWIIDSGLRRIKQGSRQTKAIIWMFWVNFESKKEIAS